MIPKGNKLIIEYDSINTGYNTTNFKYYTSIKSNSTFNEHLTYTSTTKIVDNREVTSLTFPITFTINYSEGSDIINISNLVINTPSDTSNATPIDFSYGISVGNTRDSFHSFFYDDIIPSIIAKVFKVGYEEASSVISNYKEIPSINRVINTITSAAFTKTVKEESNISATIIVVYITLNIPYDEEKSKFGIGTSFKYSPINRVTA